MVGVLAALAIGVSLSWLFWEDLRGSDESLSATIRNLGLVIGGVIAGLLAMWRSKVAERQAATAQEGLRNERYQTGAKMLGSAVLSERLGGIYALQRLAHEQPKQYHVQIMRLFCAFVRHPIRDERIEQAADGEEQDDERSRRRQDVQAIMEAIAARGEAEIQIEKQHRYRPDLYRVQLERIYLTNANLSRADLGGVNLSRAILEGADLSDTWLGGGDLSDARLHCADLSDARLSDANLSGANLSEAILRRAKMLNADLPEAILFRAKLPGADLTGAKLPHASLTEANLSGAYLRNASLRGAGFAGSKMSGADLSRADLSGARFTSLVRHGAKECRSNPAIGLSQSQLDEACADEGNGPDLKGVVDAETGEPLVWRGRIALT